LHIYWVTRLPGSITGRHYRTRPSGLLTTVTVDAVGMFASVASVRVLAVCRTRRHYIYFFKGQILACGGPCSQNFNFRYEIGRATSAVCISCALWFTSPDFVWVFSSHIAVWPSNKSSLRTRVSFCTEFGFYL
jgi:hypothetical protein